MPGGDVGGQLGDGGVEHLEVVHHRRGPGVAGPQQGGQGLAGASAKQNIGAKPKPPL